MEAWLWRSGSLDLAGMRLAEGAQRASVAMRAAVAGGPTRGAVDDRDSAVGTQ